MFFTANQNLFFQERYDVKCVAKGVAKKFCVNWANIQDQILSLIMIA